MNRQNIILGIVFVACCIGLGAYKANEPIIIESPAKAKSSLEYAGFHCVLLGPKNQQELIVAKHPISYDEARNFCSFIDQKNLARLSLRQDQNFEESPSLRVVNNYLWCIGEPSLVGEVCKIIR